MYVPPRPLAEDDPLFSLRLACGTVLGLLAAVLIQSKMPMLPPALIVGIMAGMRKAFSAKKAFGGPILLGGMAVVISSIIEFVYPLPMVTLMVIWGLCVASYAIILHTGNPIGMLIAVVIVLMSVTRAGSLGAMLVIRDGFVEASVVAAIAIPILYALFPPAAKDQMVEDYSATTGPDATARALLRGSVLLFMSVWVYTVLGPNNLMFALAAVFVLVFPSRQRLYAEARQRVFATIIGGTIALLILTVFPLVANLPILLILIFLASLMLGGRMMHGQYPPMVYQYALSVVIALTVGGLTSQEPVGATVLRVMLTLFGVIVAALLTAALEEVLFGRDPQKQSIGNR